MPHGICCRQGSCLGYLSMKYALVNALRQEAQPRLLGACPACGSPMVAKCGEERIWHWAHKGCDQCDPWWENEGPWHREWKGRFPEAWQEVVRRGADAERHIADVQTDRGWVLEFQHSYLDPKERRSRDAFYRPKLIWVVDALRRDSDFSQFDKMMKGASCLGATGSFWAAHPDSCRLVKEWSGSDAQILFDFGTNVGLWWMLGRLSNDQVLFARYTHSQFIEAHGGIESPKESDFDALVNQLDTLVKECERLIRSPSTRWSRTPLPPPGTPSPRNLRRR